MEEEIISLTDNNNNNKLNPIREEGDSHTLSSENTETDDDNDNSYTASNTEQKEVINEWCRFEFKNNNEINPLTELMEINAFTDDIDDFRNYCEFLIKDTPNNISKKKVLNVNNGLPILDLNFNSSNLRLKTVTKNIEERIKKFGVLEDINKFIRKNKTNNENYYEQDDSFIDDGFVNYNKKMEVTISAYEHFGSLNGNIEDFFNSNFYKEREQELLEKK